jgi:aminopeptidase N
MSRHLGEDMPMEAGIMRRLACISLALFLCIGAGNSQNLTQPFEKQGRFVAPDGGLSRAKRHLDIHTAPANTAFKVVSYSLDLSLAMVDENLSGRNRITLVMKSAADSVVLYQLKLQIDSVIVGGLQRLHAEDDAAERFTVRLGSLRQAGDTVRLVVSYRRLPGTARSTDRLGYYYFCDTIPGLPANIGYTMSEPSNARCWMPCYDEPWEKSTSEISVTVPQGYIAASNGKLLETVLNPDGTITWHWKETHQIATYLMCATVSKYTVPASTMALAPGDSIPVEYFVWANDSAAAGAYLPTVRLMIANLSTLFGPYPWDKYGMCAVNPFDYGGMEHQTITTLHEARVTNEETVVHELAHQWWGDLVTCGSWPDIWLNESFATYSQALWHETLGGPAALRASMQSMLGFNLGSWTGAVYDPEGQGIHLFDNIVYSKGAWVLHTLRGVIGDTSFFRSLRLWRQLYSEKSAVTADFQAAVESVTGRDISWFFDEWIYGPGWPVYAISSAWLADTVTVRIAQQQDPSRPAYTMPLQIRVYTGKHDTTLTIQDSLRTQDFSFPFAVKPDSVLFDPDSWVLHQTGTRIDPPPAPGTPVSFLLRQNYPNPFNAGTTISYFVPGIVSRSAPPAGVTITVYDFLGRRVATLLDGPQFPGEHSVRFEGTGCASGVYFYRVEIRSPGGTSTRAVGKMVMVR